LAKPTNDLSSEQANFNCRFPDGKAPEGKYLERTTRVGAYPANKLGLCDMHGNVWQWCADLLSPEGSDRVFRGGGWGFNGQGCRSASRSGLEPADRSRDLGFRVALVPSGGK
jgi:formylglycine-generating enzyme required for sulfatase activity